MFLYKDLDARMAGHPVKKDLFIVVDSEAINRSLRMIVNTNFYERPFNSEFGANVRALLFELADDSTAAQVEQRIITQITKYEPRISVEKVAASVSDNTLTVSIYYRIINSTEVNSVQIQLRVVR